jgi:hypothetical protein
MAASFNFIPAHIASATPAAVIAMKPRKYNTFTNVVVIILSNEK